MWKVTSIGETVDYLDVVVSIDGVGEYRNFYPLRTPSKLDPDGVPIEYTDTEIGVEHKKAGATRPLLYAAIDADVTEYVKTKYESKVNGTQLVSHPLLSKIKPKMSQFKDGNDILKADADLVSIVNSADPMASMESFLNTITYSNPNDLRKIIRKLVRLLFVIAISGDIIVKE